MRLLVQLQATSTLGSLADLLRSVLGSDFQLTYYDVADAKYPELERRFQGFIERELDFVVELDVALRLIFEAERAAQDSELDIASGYIDEACSIFLTLYSRACYLKNLRCFLPILAVHLAFCHACKDCGESKRHWIKIARHHLADS